ncbi:MAG TPA: penicillin-binding protein activator [Acetobacteraceae bacterium]|nr:penicillin-binding protein activator [Acetobacteraceae bacterium]
MRRRAFLVLSASAALAGCTGAEYPPAPPYLIPGPPGSLLGPFGPGAVGGAPARPVAILLPLSGPRAELGQPMLQAAQLALADPTTPPLIPEDTGGTAAGAGTAARGALAQGAGLILGPLTAAETEAVAPIATAAGVPVLAFTNTTAAARPGVWALGITPGQQVRRLLAYAQEQGRGRVAALLPESQFGHAMAQALTAAAEQRGLPPPEIRFHGTGMAAINSAVRQISDYEQRWGPVQQRIKEARAQGTPEGRREAERLTRSSVPPPPFDALLLGDTGDSLAELASMLSYYFVGPPSVQVMGPALWAAPGSGASQVRGAWFAAPDPAARANFEQAFAARYGGPPPGAADLAFDAASIARAVAPQGDTMAALVNPDGFSGADGWLRLLPDGQVQRGLAILQVGPGGPRVISPAPTSAAAEI